MKEVRVERDWKDYEVQEMGKFKKEDRSERKRNRETWAFGVRNMVEEGVKKVDRGEEGKDWEDGIQSVGGSWREIKGKGIG